MLHSELHERIQREETNRVGMLSRLRDVLQRIQLSKHFFLNAIARDLSEISICSTTRILGLCEVYRVYSSYRKKLSETFGTC